MYPQHSHLNIWAFLLAIIVFGAFLMLGADLTNATWLSRPIAEAQANDMRVQTEITRKNAELDYEQRKFYMELERQKAQQQAEQELQAQAARDAEALAFQKTIHTVTTAGLWIVALAIALGLFTASIFAGIGLSRYLNALAQTKQAYLNNRERAKTIEQLVRQNSILQRQISDLKNQIIELEQPLNSRVRRNLMKDTTREWPDDPEDYLSRIPPSWAG